MSYFYSKITLIFSVIGFLSITNVSGQKLFDKSKVLQKTNLSRLHILEAKYASNRLQKRQQAERLAERFGWELKKIDAHGNFMELQEVSLSGKPKYYITHGNVLFNLGAANTTGTSSLWTGGRLGLDLNGEGMYIGMWDGGAVRLTHQEFDVNDFQSDDAATSSNHATHVAGTLVGRGINSLAKGMAAEGSLMAYDWNSDEAEMAAAAANGLLISNHSYGWSPLFLATWEFGYYDTQAESWDDIQYHAPYYLIVKSAGNDRNGYNTSKGGYDLINGASTSKNALVVGGVEGVASYDQPSDVVMSGFSAWGPTDDGRIKPDISAKGVGVFSSFGTGDNHYSTLSGTSMAAPNAAGSLILLQQHYSNLNGEFMKASTLKALVINTAEEAGDAVGPDYQFGWGLLNVERAALLISDEGVSGIMDEATLNSGDTYTRVVTSNGLVPLKANLVWTDPAGTPGPVNTVDNPLPMLVNDLDLRISRGAETYEPWILDPTHPSLGAETGDNTVDNVEGITIEFPEAGDYTITVSHKGTLSSGSQGFSLVVNGVSSGPPPVCEATIPDGLSSNVATDTAATISWNAKTEVDSYSYRYRESGTATWIGGNSASKRADLTGLRANTNYEFQVRSNCADASSAYSESLNFTSGPPSEFCATISSEGMSFPDVTDSSAKVVWEAVPGATGYNYRFRPDGDANWTNGHSAGNSVILTGLLENTTYECQVQTVCVTGNSIYTGSSTFTTDQSARIEPTSCERIPKGLIATVSGTRVEISWTPVIGAIKYQYRYRPVTGGSWVRGNATNNVVSLSGLRPNSDYTFHMRAFCGRFGPIAKFTFSTSNNLGVQAGNSHFIKNELVTDPEFVVYPNPALDMLNIEMDGFENEAHVSIYDVKGVKLIDDEIKASHGEIRISELRPGMYYIRIITQSTSAARQFIKK